MKTMMTGFQKEANMTDRYISKQQAAAILKAGFDMEKWKGSFYLERIPGTTRREWCEDECLMKEVTDCVRLPKLRLDQAAKWLREELGVDIVVSPKFNSNTGDRIGYFWRWSQRTDVNHPPTTHRTFESALNNAIDNVLSVFYDTSL